jgi:hypothetical protein
MVIVVSRGTEESMVIGGRWGGGERKTVEQVGGGVETLRPEVHRQIGLVQKGAQHIICGANQPLSLAVLGRSVRTREEQLNTVGEDEGPGDVVIELALVASLRWRR